MRQAKIGFVRPIVGGSPIPGREGPWAVDQIRELDTALSRFADQDRSFAAEYNVLVSLAAAGFTARSTDGACTLIYTGEIQSVTRAGVGTYLVAFAVPTLDTNYSVRAIAEWGAGAGVFYQTSALTVNGCTLTFFTPAGAAADPAASVHLDVKGMMA